MTEVGKSVARERILRAYAAGVDVVAPDAAVKRVLARTDFGFTVDGDAVYTR